MVYFEDMGTTLDIALDEIETFLESEEHTVAHSADVRNFEVVESDGPTIVLTYDRNFDGRWTKSRTRVTSFPPYCRYVEELEGDFAGSKFLDLHRPAGTQTRVELFGDIQCKSYGAEQTRALWLKILAKAHEEDVAALQKFRLRK